MIRKREAGSASERCRSAPDAAVPFSILGFGTEGKDFLIEFVGLESPLSNRRLVPASLARLSSALDAALVGLIISMRCAFSAMTGGVLRRCVGF
jgi:hypothetical protein